MGTSRSAGELAAKLNGYALTLPRASEAGTRQAAIAAKGAMLAAAASSGLKPGSKLAKKAWGVSYNVRSGPNPSALVKFYGPVHWVESGTKPHPITRKGDRGRMGRARKKGPTSKQAAQAATVFGFMAGQGGGGGMGGGAPLHLPGFSHGEFFRHVNHPGTKARPFWNKAVTQVRLQTRPIYAAEVHRSLVHAFAA